MREKALSLSILLVGFVLLIAVQFSIPTLFGADGYLHIRMADFLRHFGPHYTFHWARYSVFFSSFSDKDFLYHVVLIPFTFFSNIFFGMKVAAALGACVLFASVALMLKRYCAYLPVILALMFAFFLSAQFLRGISEARNMPVMIALTLWFAHLLINNRRWPLFIISAAYTLAHVSGPYLIMFAVIAEMVRWGSERRFCVKNILWVAVGVAVGMLIHPNFPHNLRVFYLNGIAVPIFALKWGLELGAEFFPLDTREFVLSYPFLVAALLLIVALGASRNNAIKTSTKIWLAITGYFFVFSFFSRRYLIYCYPLALVSVGAFISDWAQSAPRWIMQSGRVVMRAMAGCVILGAGGILGRHTFQEFQQVRLAETVFNSHYEAVGKWMAQNIPAGEIIFHANWSDSQYFIGLNPKDDYFVTLDPIFMHHWDLAKYNVYRSLSFGRESDPYRVLKNEFKANYGYAGKNFFGGLIAQVRQDARFQVLAEDDYGVIFKLK